MAKVANAIPVLEPISTWKLRKPARLARKFLLFGQGRLSGQRLPCRFLKYYGDENGITGWWWQLRRERPLSIVEADELRLGEDVLSGSRNKISLKIKKCAISNKSIQNGQPGRHRKTRKKQKKEHRTPPHHPNVQTTSRKEPQKKKNA